MHEETESKIRTLQAEVYALKQETVDLRDRVDDMKWILDNAGL